VTPKQTTLEGVEGGSGNETIVKKVITFDRTMTKKGCHFGGKILGDTISYVSGDTNLSDTTANNNLINMSY